MLLKFKRTITATAFAPKLHQRRNPFIIYTAGKINNCRNPSSFPEERKKKIRAGRTIKENELKVDALSDLPTSDDFQLH